MSQWRRNVDMENEGRKKLLKGDTETKWRFQINLTDGVKNGIERGSEIVKTYPTF